VSFTFHRSAQRLGVTVLVAGLITTMTGCGSARGDGEVMVFAAASLTDVFTQIAADLEAEGGPRVTVSFAGSSTLSAQIIEGAPADVFASASLVQMEEVMRARPEAGAPVVFATNGLVIVVERGNPLGIRDVTDLADDDVTVAVADAQVPVGAYSAAMLAAAGVALEPVTLEFDVRGVLTKVELGEVDAGVVYATDASSSDGVDSIAVPDEFDQQAEYPIVALSDDDADAKAFISYVLSDAGRVRLDEFGFGAP
jgi:molybdate transport system substrate-binding protein